MASATCIPATKRAEVRWPKRELSARLRSHRLSESAINVALSPRHRAVAGSNCQRRSLALQYFLSYGRQNGRDRDHSCRGARFAAWGRFSRPNMKDQSATKATKARTRCFPSCDFVWWVVSIVNLESTAGFVPRGAGEAPSLV